MKAAVYHGPGDLRVEEVSIPEIEEDEVLWNLRNRYPHFSR